MNTSFNYFFTPVGPEYKKKFARNVCIAVLILFTFYGVMNLIGNVSEPEETKMINDAPLDIPSVKEFLSMDCEEINHLYPEFSSEEVADAWNIRMHECLNEQAQLHELIELGKWRQVSCNSILNDGTPKFQNRLSQQSFDIRWTQCMEIMDFEKTLIFDPSLYYEEFGKGSPLIYKETHKPVLDEANCNRYAYWMTEHQKEKPEFVENYSRYPPWGNQIFPLVGYCLDNGSLVKTIFEDKFDWRFQLENEN